MYRIADIIIRNIKIRINDLIVMVCVVIKMRHSDSKIRYNVMSEHCLQFTNRVSGQVGIDMLTIKH